MKRQYFKIKRFFAAICLMAITSSAFSQFADITQVVMAGVEDAELLLEAYVAPFGKGVGADIGSGWYNTAKPHKLGGFDLTFGVHMATIPEIDKTFIINDVGFNALTSTAAESPTIAGVSGEAGAPMLLDPLPITAPPGAGLEFVPLPTLNLAIGFIKNTEIIGRFVPNTAIAIGDTDYGSIGLWGVGVKHDFLQWIPGDKLIPIDASILIGYTNLNIDFNIPEDAAITPDTYGTNITDNTTFAYNDQKLNFGANALNISLIASKKLLIFTPYIGVGMIKSNVNLSLLGHYPVPGAIDPNGFVMENSHVQLDPFEVEIPNTMMHATVGLRIKLAVLTIHGQYTAGEYKTMSAGIGISFR